jgi:hypothetical protein
VAIADTWAAEDVDHSGAGVGSFVGLAAVSSGPFLGGSLVRLVGSAGPAGGSCLTLLNRAVELVVAAASVVETGHIEAVIPALVVLGKFEVVETETVVAGVACEIEDIHLAELEVDQTGSQLEPE